MRYVVGVDVGTGSARAGLFDETGRIHRAASRPIPIHRPKAEWAEQSSDAIWQAVCEAVRDCVATAEIAPEQVAGISYSATCSLVLLDTNGAPLRLSEGPEGWNIIVWMDHRAIAEAEEITRSGSPVLDNVGGTMSPEMEIPKLMWLKRHRPGLWAQLGFAGDLADYLTYRSSGSLDRSVCTLGCKWTYDPDAGAWNTKFLADMGLADLLAKGRLPDQAVPVGSPLGPLSAEAAEDLGLTTDCRVAAGLIDAHAGALGTIGLFVDDRIESRMALIAGTSNCHIGLSRSRREVPGVWGPYGGAVVDGMWCTEGGQSATGALLDHLVDLMAPDDVKAGPLDALSDALKQRADALPDFAGVVDVIPDFIGNRAPFADAELRGSISGLTIEAPEETFAKTYWAAAAGIAYGTRLIIEQMNRHGYAIDTIHLSGGHRKSALLIDLYADATGCDVVLSEAEEPVLLGAAIAALCQFEESDAVSRVTARMVRDVEVRYPRQQHMELHEARYRRFLKHYSDKGYRLR
ncbi:FGGY-family pentulose kinase [Rhodobium orientis]|uniref:Ribulokinase n=1 Tax=Rhodobium orientis TaxID=34017 RepID=A0A327JM99_9HYPH|nr:FGGY-family carbohydrate kinase [Rhodobium orientis]MBB4304569.1 FGGY-family pentulose kinase [Rhodobium orientis]MBK5951396.1 hypothetical protein [Rhodobium orientis]RAI27529.1 hypothetical protein CH339_09840 [Rhodobium orientis]